MTKTLLLLSILFAAACGPKGSKGGTDPCKDPCKDQKLAAMTCDVMADNVGASMQAHGMPAEEADPMNDMFEDECTSMGWSQETIDCMAAASNEEDGEACMVGMSEEQSASLEAKFNELEHNGKGGDESEEEME